MSEKRICRACLSELEPKESRSLFAAGKIMGMTLNLAQVLIACANLKIARNDGLPQEICLRCIDLVSRAYSFKLQCERNQQILFRRAGNTLKDIQPIENSLNISPVKESVTSSYKSDSDEDVDVENCLVSDPEDSQNSELPKNTRTSRIVRNPPNKLNVTLKSRIRSRKLYKCKTCGKTFPSEFSIKKHRAQEHTKTKICKCELCEKIFRTEEQMKRHINIHNTGKPLQCETCGKAFTQRADYVAHTYSHTGERPFLCTECGKSFKRNSELRIHMRTHLDLRPYQCKICGKSYRTSSTFAIHKRSHSGERPFVCKYCDKTFKSSACLKNHTHIHTGVKPHTCDYCGRGFIKAYALTIHKRTHTQERPHVCAICGKDFNQAVCLRMHMKHHEKAEV